MDWIKTEAKALENELLEVRRFLHGIPEIGDQLPQTKAFVCAYLDKIGVPYRCLSDCDGVVAEIKGTPFGKTVAFRADMDGLHIQEETDVPFQSKIAGQMHGCGHDAHTAILLLTAKLLNRHRSRLQGNVVLIFQTGEETGSGAKKMIASGAIDNADALFALHVGNLAGDTLASGDFAILPGFVSAGKIKFTITVKGKGTHSAFPERGIDPITVAAKILMGFKDIMENEVASGSAAILSVGSIHAGEDHNTIPETATLKGSVRAQEPSTREALARKAEELSSRLAAEAGAICFLDIKRGSESVCNDDAMAALAADAVASVLGEKNVRTQLPNPLMASDDFSNYAKRIPSVYFMLHTNDEKKGIMESNHNPRFDIDENVLWEGIAAYTAIAIKFLNADLNDIPQ